MAAFDARLVTYAPNGARTGLLPRPSSWSAAFPLGDVPALSLSYSSRAIRADVLADPLEVAVEYNAGAGWVEAPGGRFCTIADSDNATDAGQVKAITAPGYAWLLGKARLFPSAFDNAEGKRPFLSATPGTILRTLVDEAQARGVLPGLAVDFTADTDSAGQPWAKVLTIYYSPGIDVLSVLANLTDQGVVEWQTQGRTLQVFNADTALARNLADVVDLRLGRDVDDAPNSSTLADVVARVYVKGEGSFHLVLDNPGAPAPWGPWETFITQGGVSDEGTARILAQGTLAQGAERRVQLTRSVRFGAARLLPFVDYRPGDTVSAPGQAGRLEPLRVRQITLARDERGQVAGNLVLNDRFVESTIRQARRTQGIVGGSTADGGTGARPAPDQDDPRLPEAPDGLVVSSDSYLDADGTARGQVTVTWAPVDTSTEGTALEVAGYELWHRRNTAGLQWTRATETVDPDVQVTLSGLYDVGTQWAFKVRARSAAGRLGDFSAAVLVDIAEDVDAPPVPSTPVASARLGTISVEWDGRGAAGEPMPADFAAVDVWMDALGPSWRADWADPGQLPAPWKVTGAADPAPAVDVAGGRVRATAGSNVLIYRAAGGQDYRVDVQDMAAAAAVTSSSAFAAIFARFDPVASTSIMVTWTPGTGAAVLQIDPGAAAARSVPITVPAGLVVDPYSVTIGLDVRGDLVRVDVDGQLVHTETLTAAELTAIVGTLCGIGWSHTDTQASAGAVALVASEPPTIWADDFPGFELDPNSWDVLNDDGSASYSVQGGRVQLNMGTDLLFVRDTPARDYTITAHDLKVGDSYRTGLQARHLAGPSTSWPYGERCIAIYARRNGDTTLYPLGWYLRYEVRGETASRTVELQPPAGVSPDGLKMALTVNGRQVQVHVNDALVLVDELTAAEDAELVGRQAGLYFEGTGSSVGLVTAKSTASAGAQLVGELRGRGGLVVAHQPYLQDRTFWFEARDRSGNLSGVSGTATVQTVPLVDPDLVDRVIRGDHIMANTITADNIAAGAIEAGHIQADAVDGKTITAATIRTGSSYPRVEITLSGLSGYDSSQTLVTRVSSATGQIDAAGTIRTGLTGVRTIMRSNAFGGYPGIHFTGMAGSPSFEPTIHGREDGQLWLLSAEDVGNSSGRADLILQKGGAFKLGQSFGNANNTVSVEGNADGILTFKGRLPTGYTATTALTAGSLYVGPGSVSVRINYGATFVGQSFPVATAYTNSPTTTDWSCAGYDNSGFQFSWSGGVDIMILYLVARV